MNTIKSIIRLAILFGLCALGLCLIFHQETYNDIIFFCLKIFFNKAMGIACLFAVGLLYCRWSKTDRLLIKYEKWFKEAEQTRL